MVENPNTSPDPQEKPEFEGSKLPPVGSKNIRALGFKRKVERDWTLMLVGKENQLVLERIDDKGKRRKKTISLDEFLEYNPEPVAESASESGGEVVPKPEFNGVTIDKEVMADYLSRASDDEKEKLTQRLDSLLSLLAADPSMADNKEHYSLKITDTHSTLTVLNNSKEIEIGIDVLMRDDKPVELLERMITEGIHSSFKSEPPTIEGVVSDSEPEHEQKTELTAEPEREEEPPLILEDARMAYTKAHKEYLEKNKPRKGSVLGIGGDTSAIKEAREAYDAALKAATKAEREKMLKETGYSNDDRNPNIRARINKSIFEKFVVDEERKMASLKVSEMPEEKQGWYKKAWVAYARLPRWKKIAISTTISTGVGLAAGGGVGVLYRRAVSPFVSAGAGFLTNVGFGAYDKTLGKKNTKEYQIGALLQEHTEDVSESLDDMKFQYRDILEKQADREQKRMYLRIAIAAAAGATVSGIIAHNMPSAGGVAEHHVPAEGKPLVPDHATPEHHANIPPHPAETTPFPKAPEHIPPAVEHASIEVHKGDSLWEITAKELQKDPGFDKLNDAQKTWMISSVVDRAAEHKDALGFTNPDALAVGEKIDLSSILKDSDVHGLMEKAGHLTAAQQEHILANDHAIASWLHAHPHEQLTGARVNEIVNDRLHPRAVPEHVRVGAIAEQIHKLPPNPEQGQILIERINGMDQIPSMEMRQLLLIAAERVGDHHPLLIDMNNVAEVHRQMRDYLVSYPRAQEFGFRSYDHWARVRDVPVRRFAEDTTISPRPEALQSALRHSFFHRGASVHEMQDGALRRVPLEERHANLGMALRGNSELVRRAPETTTVGDFVAAHHGTIRRK